MKSVFILFLLASSLNSQPLNITVNNNRVPGYYTVFNGVEVILNEEEYIFIKDSTELSKKLLNGKKIFITAGDQYCAIVNFGFRKDKSDYPVDIMVFNSGLDNFTYSFSAPYGLPHPSVNLTDDGKIILFNSLNYEITEYSTEDKKEYRLEKSIGFEMERSFFTGINDQKFYVFISETPVSPEEDTENVYLYVSDLAFQNVSKKLIDVEVPVYLGFSDRRAILSGVEFDGQLMHSKSFIIDEELFIEVPAAFEDIIEFNGNFVGKYGNTLYTMNKDLEIISSRVFENNIADLAVSNSEIIVIVKADGWRLIKMDNDMNIKSDFPLSDVGPGQLPVLSEVDGRLLLHDNNYTYILNEFVRRNK